MIRRLAGGLLAVNLCACPALAGQPAGAAASDWPQLGNGPGHTGCSAEKLAPPFALKWNVQFQPERLYPAGQAVVASGRVFLGTESGNLYALGAADGRRLWKFPAAPDEHVGPILHAAGVEKGKVFFAAMDGCVYALAAEDGRRVWRFDSRLRTGFSTAVLLAEGKVFAANRGGVLFALNQADGSVAWKKSFDAALLQTPAYSRPSRPPGEAGRVYVAAMDMRLHALDARTGKPLWRTERIEGLTFKDYWPVVCAGLVIVRPMGPWEASAFHEATGAPAAIKIPGGVTMNGAVAPPCVDSAGRLVTARGGGWVRVDVRTGQVEPISEKAGRGGRGNRDENMVASACGDVIFVMHCQEGNAQFTGCYQLSTRTWTPIRGGPWLNFTSNTQGGGASQASIAGGRVYHVSLHGLRCFEGGKR